VFLQWDSFRRFAVRGKAVATASASLSARRATGGRNGRREGGWRRAMSTKGRSMRRKVEKQMVKETGHMQLELRRTIKL
jgi:hypothetical protein